MKDRRVISPSQSHANSHHFLLLVALFPRRTTTTTTTTFEKPQPLRDESVDTHLTGDSAFQSPSPAAPRRPLVYSSPKRRNRLTPFSPPHRKFHPSMSTTLTVTTEASSSTSHATTDDDDDHAQLISPTTSHGRIPQSSGDVTSTSGIGGGSAIPHLRQYTIKMRGISNLSSSTTASVPRGKPPLPSVLSRGSSASLARPRASTRESRASTVSTISSHHRRYEFDLFSESDTMLSEIFSSKLISDMDNNLGGGDDSSTIATFDDVDDDDDHDLHHREEHSLVPTAISHCENTHAHVNTAAPSTSNTPLLPKNANSTPPPSSTTHKQQWMMDWANSSLVSSHSVTWADQQPDFGEKPYGRSASKLGALNLRRDDDSPGSAYFQQQQERNKNAGKRYPAGRSVTVIASPPDQRQNRKTFHNTNRANQTKKATRAGTASQTLPRMAADIAVHTRTRRPQQHLPSPLPLSYMAKSEETALKLCPMLSRRLDNAIVSGWIAFSKGNALYHWLTRKRPSSNMGNIPDKFRGYLMLFDDDYHHHPTQVLTTTKQIFVGRRETGCDNLNDIIGTDISIEEYGEDDDDDDDDDDISYNEDDNDNTEPSDVHNDYDAKKEDAPNQMVEGRRSNETTSDEKIVMMNLPDNRHYVVEMKMVPRFGKCLVVKHSLSHQVCCCLLPVLIDAEGGMEERKGPGQGHLGMSHWDEDGGVRSSFGEDEEEQTCPTTTRYNSGEDNEGSDYDDEAPVAQHDAALHLMFALDAWIRS